ncbi:hypothetical protein AB0J71_42160 [Nonomuraea sp. NPDC049637]|uniref:hypothetical protein n=1 Tax=Nonomuraea sp. NPDC049637 TaxID=3154356 RepID=UPI003444ECFB
MSGLQHHLLTAQAQAAVDAEQNCAHCGRARARKDTRQIVLRTLFGTLRLDSPRMKTCPCTPSEAATFRPIAAALPERTAPELLLWEAKYAALTSYGTAATLLAEAFPLGRPLHATTIRQQVERTATRLENELGDERFSFIDTCPRDLETMPRPNLPLVVALDGGYVHSSNQTSRRDGWFEAVTGRSTPPAAARTSATCPATSTPRPSTTSTGSTSPCASPSCDRAPAPFGRRPRTSRTTNSSA